MNARHRTLPRRHLRTSHVPRRRHPTELLAPITERLVEERVGLYRGALQLLLRGIGPYRAQLSDLVDALVLAEAAILGTAPAALSPGEREVRVVALLGGESSPESGR